MKPLALAVGLGLGFVFDWAHLTDPETFHRMLTLKSAYVYLLMATAVVVATIGMLAAAPAQLARSADR